MSGLAGVVLMSALLGAASFAIGILPLSIAFSKSALARLSALGTGLLLGAALGVVIPEGIETLAAGSAAPPTSAIALALLGGFTFMLLLEQLVSPHAHDRAPPRLPPSPTNPPAHVEFDVELGELERAEGFPDAEPAAVAAASNTNPDGRPDRPPAEGRASAYPLTLGLVMHALADGLALGSSALSGAGAAPGTDAAAVLPSSLSLVVFMALAIHKAPTALALTTSLMGAGLARAECKKHLALFSASTPLGAVASYVLLAFFGADSNGGGRWPGGALLFSGGTFLYVATVLRPVSARGAGEEIGRRARVVCTVLGMFVPFVVSVAVGHDHEHGA